MSYIIYRARNVNNHKVYFGVGRTDIQTIERNHAAMAFYYKKSHPFYSDIKKYGRSAFQWSGKGPFDTVEEVIEVIQEIVGQYNQDQVYNYHNIPEMIKRLRAGNIEPTKELYQRGNRGLNYKRNFRASKGKDDSVYWMGD